MRQLQTRIYNKITCTQCKWTFLFYLAAGMFLRKWIHVFGLTKLEYTH